MINKKGLASNEIDLLLFSIWVQEQGWAYKLDGLKENWGRAKKDYNGTGDYWEWKTHKQLIALFNTTKPH